MAAFLKPFGDSVHKHTGMIIGVAGTALFKKQPEGTLGNVLADALLESAARKLNERIDAAFLNPGGIRRPTVAAGPVTVGDMFEVMPFDNLIVLQEVTGTVLQTFLDLTAAKGGWPVAGVTMKISKNKATDVKIGGKPLDRNASYRIVNADYVANGGDNCDMLKAVPALLTDYLVRDAFIDYFSLQYTQGKKIVAQTQGRVTYAQ